VICGGGWGWAWLGSLTLTLWTGCLSPDSGSELESCVSALAMVAQEREFESYHSGSVFQYEIFRCRVQFFFLFGLPLLDQIKVRAEQLASKS